MTKNEYLLYKQAQMDFSFLGPAPDDPNVARFYLSQQGIPFPQEPPKPPTMWERLKGLFKSRKAQPQPVVTPQQEVTPLPPDAWHLGGLGM